MESSLRWDVEMQEEGVFLRIQDACVRRIIFLIARHTVDVLVAMLCNDAL